ncbi:hypothetical protein N7456_005782 [Penicillium angulare]|uniref:Uncharacterized protein n=1 Tax=Penicillium angulare TaxID=116970 RepID=A0A9W9FZ62_9EURO|nr:hypothetical protein N7456_005782 [Penicillium angulare]
MALGQQSPYMNLNHPGPRHSVSSQGNQGYQSDVRNMTGPYGHYGLQAAQQGAYDGGQIDPGWTERVLEEMKDMLLLLDADGNVAYASPSSKQITGRGSKQLEGNTITSLIHEDDKAVFVRDMNESVTGNRPFRSHARLQKTNSTYCLVEIYGHPHIGRDNVPHAGNVSPQERCLGFFLVCRPHPSKNSLLLDSFLEHKIENARLVQHIAKLKQEEEEEDEGILRGPYGTMDGDRQFADNALGQAILSDQDSSETAAPGSDDSDASQDPDYFTDGPPAMGHLSHVDGIEVMTGLNYADGERSQGLSTGNRGGKLIQCSIDITTAADQARTVQEGDRRKRLKGQHSCSDCGTGDSPEWRKGPNGPKTLCNACGLRWSKKEKKRQAST